MFCTRCGAQNPDVATFCAKCGATLVRPGEPVATGSAESPVEMTSTVSLAGLAAEPEHEPEHNPDDDVDSLPAGTALLVVKRGPNAGSRFLLDQPVTTAGRHPESDIFLDDVTVSRRHAEFRRTDDVFSVSDVGSLNGTYVNRERIDTITLTGGDEVQVGKFRLVLLLASTPAGDGGAAGSGGGT